MKLYVGNLDYNVSDAELTELFSAHGTVTSANIIVDRMTGRAKGFGFVEMDDEQAKAAIAALNGQQFKGRALTVSEARPKPEGGGGGRGGFGGGRGGHGGGRGGYGGGRGGHGGGRDRY